MALVGPVLDDRTYDQLRDDLVRRIPVYAPEWTDHNDTDPGIALLQLFAHLGESVLFRFNQIPDATKVAFLRLLGLQPRPAQAARALLAVRTDAPDGVQVLRDTVARAGSVGFRTTGEVYAWPLDVVAVIKRPAPDPAPGPAATRELNRRKDALTRAVRNRPGATSDASYFEVVRVPDDPAGPDGPVDVSTSVDGSLWVALAARRPELRAGLLRALGGRSVFLGVALDESVPALESVVPLVNGTTAEKTLSSPALTSDPLPVEWQLWRPAPDGSSPGTLAPVVVDGDSTRGLATNGVVMLTLPKDLPDLAAADAPSGDRDVPPPLDDDAVTARVVAWLRVRRPEGSADAIHRVVWAGANGVEAEQGEPAGAELLGTGTGDAGQTFPLARRPVLPGSLRLQVEDADGWQPWTAVDSLASSAPDAPHYVLDPAAGLVTFGSAGHGRIPLLGQRIRVLGYVVGGGSSGNVPAGAVTSLVGHPVTVTNPLPAQGGADAASLTDALDAIPQTVHRRDRAVVADDFAALATEVAGVARADTLPLFHPDSPTTQAAGVVSVVVLPAQDLRSPDAPVPDLSLLRRVATYLDARRLATTELYVVPPGYRRLALSVSVVVRSGYQVDAVRRWVDKILRQYLSPLPGLGPDGAGWPMGRAVRRGELEAVAVQVEGVESVDALRLADVETGTVDEKDVVALDRWELPSVVDLAVVPSPTPAPDPGTGAPPPPDGGILVPLPPDVC